MWTHVVLEIYRHTWDNPWPTEGNPADWIEQGLVGYCQGSIEDLVILTPLWKLLWWKLKRLFVQ